MIPPGLSLSPGFSFGPGFGGFLGGKIILPFSAFGAAFRRIGRCVLQKYFLNLSPTMAHLATRPHGLGTMVEFISQRKCGPSGGRSGASHLWNPETLIKRIAMVFTFGHHLFGVIPYCRFKNDLTVLVKMFQGTIENGKGPTVF